MGEDMPKLTELWEFLGKNGWNSRLDGYRYSVYKNGYSLTCFYDSTEYGWHLVLDNREPYSSNEYRCLHIRRDTVRYLYGAMADPDMSLGRVETAMENAELAKKLESMPGGQ